MKRKPKKGKADKNIHAYYVELESPLDLGRQVFDYTSRYIEAIKDKGKYTVFSVGEKIGDIRLVYYFKTDKISDFFVYTPESDHSEKYEITDKLPSQADYKSYRAPIVEILSNPYTEVKNLKKAGKIIKIEAKDSNAFIKSLVGHSSDNDSPQKLYSFYENSNHIIGTFEFFHESGAKIFTYAKIGIKEKFSALRYDYIKDSIEAANSFTEKSAVYIRVINLKKPFPFF